MDRAKNRDARLATAVVARGYEPTIAIISCRKTRTIRGGGQILQPLTAAVTQWINETKAGRDAWRDSCEDFNVGDLAACLEDAELKARLKALGVNDLEINLIMDSDQQEGWVYDTVLVDRSALVKRTRARKALP